MDDLMSWLRRVLDETERVARTTGYDPLFQPEGFSAVLARVNAERALAHLHRPYKTFRYVGPPPRQEPYTVCEGCSADVYGWFVDFPCDTLRWLAYGHRYDAAGYRAEWAPEGVDVSRR